MEMSDLVVKVNIILISKNISVVLNNSLGLKNTVRTLLTVPPPILVSFNKASVLFIDDERGTTTIPIT